MEMEMVMVMVREMVMVMIREMVMVMVGDGKGDGDGDGNHDGDDDTFKSTEVLNCQVEWRKVWILETRWSSDTSSVEVGTLKTNHTDERVHTQW